MGVSAVGVKFVTDFDFLFIGRRPESKPIEHGLRAQLAVRCIAALTIVPNDAALNFNLAKC